MHVYHYHPETGEYLGASEADESPREPGVFLIPAHATETPPPADEPGFIARFVDGAWGYSPVVSPEEPPEETPVVTTAMVDLERDRRITAGFEFAGAFFQTRLEDRENIAGASTAALAAIVAGAAPGDFRWHGEDADFEWIAADNSTHAMDAQTMFAFGQAAMLHKSRHIFAARAIKDADPIPLDFADDEYWPS